MPIDYHRVDAVLFDVDGTLRDTDDELVHRLQRVLRWGVGRKRAVSWARPVVVSLEQRLQAILGLADRCRVDGPINRLIDLLAPRSRTSIVPAVAEVLRTLEGRVVMGVVSTGPQRQVERFLEQHDLRHHFSVIVTSQTYSRTKPHPAPVLGALRSMGIDPHAALMVGDTTVDIKAGKAAGTQTYGVLTGFGRRRDLVRQGADQIESSLVPLAEGIIERSAHREVV